MSNLGHIDPKMADSIELISYRVLQPNMILPIYIGIGQYLKPWYLFIYKL